MIKLRFLKYSLPYSAGECAWFTEAQAAPFLKQEFAERVEDAGAFVPAPPRLARAAAPEGAAETARKPAAEKAPGPGAGEAAEHAAPGAALVEPAAEGAAGPSADEATEHAAAGASPAA